MWELQQAARLPRSVRQHALLAVPALSGRQQDDGAFILMGDDYKSNEFVANLSNVSDFIAPIAFVGDMLTMDFFDRYRYHFRRIDRCGNNKRFITG